MKFSVHIRSIACVRAFTSERITASKSAKTAKTAVSGILCFSCCFRRESFLQSGKAEFIVELTLFVIT